MKWSDAQAAELTEMCMAGTSNADMAVHFDVPVTEIHAKRSAMGITIPKVKAMQGNAAIIADPVFEAAVQKMEGADKVAGEGLEIFGNGAEFCIVLARHDDTALIAMPFNACTPFVVPLQHRRGESEWWQGRYFGSLETAFAYYQKEVSHGA